MRAWRVHDLGEPVEVLTLDEVPEPTPGPGEVLLAVAGAGLNFPDVLMCRGEYQLKPALPFTPGAEVAGTVIAVGDGVDSLAVGQRVLAIPKLGTGGLSQQTLAAADTAYPIPDGLDWPAAASVHITYQTGHLALHHRAHLLPGETLLVHAGAGGVGSAAIQLGRAAGAHVIATAGGPEKTQVCRDIGADLAIDYTADDFVVAVKDATGGHGADVVYDPVGGDVFDRSRRCVAFEGRILVIGFTSGRIPDAPANHILIKNYAVVGVHWGLYQIMEPDRTRVTHGELMRLHAAGQIAPLVSEVVGMADAADRVGRLAHRGTWGKVVVDPTR
ncbi:MAG: NADPH:quinone oxidoreductase family protein [Acidimicrobiia bacterium]